MLAAARRGKVSRLTPLLVALYLLGILFPCSVAAADSSGHCAPIPSEVKAAPERTVGNSDGADTGDVVNDEAPVRGCCKVMCAQIIPVAPPNTAVDIRPSIKAAPHVESNIVGAAPKRLIRPPISSVSI